MFWVRKIYEVPQDWDGRAAILFVLPFCGVERNALMMNLILLLMAIVLEVCGDASIRVGLRGGRPVLFLVGAALVICYGTMISFPNWSFGRTMGVYIAMFFIVSQIVARFTLGESVTVPILVGGSLIISGGLVILLWRPA